MRRTPSPESLFIAWLRRRFESAPGVRTGIGDDAAVIATKPGSAWVVTTDMLLEGTHFDLGRESAAAVGRKAMNVNVSDIAAMGCVPRFAVTALGLGPAHGMRTARALYRGLHSAAQASGVALVGGDTNAHAGGLVIAVTLLGMPPRGARPILRSGARPGDALCVTGALGGSILGRHLRFAPRTATALALRRIVRVHAMIDLSDGLSTDLGHILEESGGGAVVEAARVPISAAARRLSRRTGKAALAHALNDGEDFELLFTLPALDAARIDGETIAGARVTRIGRITRATGAWLESAAGKRTRLVAAGYQHKI